MHARYCGGVVTHRYAAAFALVKVRNVTNLNQAKGLPSRASKANNCTERARNRNLGRAEFLSNRLKSPALQAIGNSTKKDEPARPSESTQIRPFIRVTSSREM